MGGRAIVTDTNIFSGLESNTTGVTAFSMPAWQLALWATAYLGLVLVAVTGNATVIWIILAHERMRTVTNYFIINLALADLCMAAFNATFNFVYASHNIWYFGRAFCYFQNLFPITAMFVSIYSMTAIAADRYMAIVHPFQPRLSAPITKATIAGIWLVALALASPQCFYSTITVDQGATKCVVAWPNDNGGKMLLLYHLVVFVLVYFLPLVVMFVAYSVIGLTLWKRAVPRHQAHGANLRHLHAKKKFVKAMVLVVLTFAICWLPYHLYFILGSFQKDIYYRKFIQQVYLALFWLAMSSTMYNPIIYCCLNHRFRSGFRLAFRCCPWVTPTEEDRLELTRTPSLSRRVNRCHTKETLFMTADMTHSEATNGQVGSPQDVEPAAP
uniref:Substance-K receptor n=2 Tax=Mesocricetus auratus TaxID=10036 RepID=NK2R_MESAU|nr:RecName: Full=Substance-K receptor; Short=SKR; AltName: Full=NK-2 receptor; Short=NK-2R; AltName: Full=Neurokinin A receptor; AltName: Full=Tachykinin receptor 2 [Mesocricetus auratus]pir/I57957/ neurokinin 2 receptor - hamster [Cricetinae gen. sp.]AAC60680.1 neurokinin A receptor [Cricetinae]